MTRRPIDFAAIAGTLRRNRSTPEAAAFWGRAEHDEAVDLLRSWLWHNLAIGGALAEAYAQGRSDGIADGWHLQASFPGAATPPPAAR